MIKKRRIRKIIEVKRRNPLTRNQILGTIFSTDIAMALYKSSMKSLTNLLVIYNQGYECEDCDELYMHCECEKCDDCWQNKCLCPLEVAGVYDFDLTGRNKIRKIIWEFARHTYVRLEDVIETLNHYDLNTKEYDLLRSLTPSTKFPEYAKLARRLF